jgi:hypothetical protein
MVVARRATIEERVTFCVAGEHASNFSDQAPVSPAGLIDKGVALGRRKLDSGLEHFADLAKFVRAQNADRLRLVHRKIASLTPSLSVLRTEGRMEQHL